MHVPTKPVNTPTKSVRLPTNPVSVRTNPVRLPTKPKGFLIKPKAVPAKSRFLPALPFPKGKLGGRHTVTGRVQTAWHSHSADDERNNSGLTGTIPSYSGKRCYDFYKHTYNDKQIHRL